MQPTFQKWTDVTAQNLRQKLNGFKEEVNAKYGFDREGANLPGLDEVASDCDRMMMIGILEELAEIKEEKDAMKEKDSRYQVSVVDKQYAL